ncbi:MAG: porin [Planctomycetota bacterium]
MRASAAAAVLMAAGSARAGGPGSDDRVSLLRDAAGRAWSEEAPRRFRINGLLQTRWNGNIRQTGSDPSVDDFDAGFELRRVRLSVTGDLTPVSSDVRLRYFVQAQFSRSTGVPTIFDAVVSAERGRWRARAGQFIVPLTREALVSNQRRLAVEDSLTNIAFGFSNPAFRSQGVEGRYRDDAWDVRLMVNDGSGTLGGGFAGEETDIGLTARVQRAWFADGETDWDRFRDFTSKRGQPLAVLVGAAGHVSFGETDADGDGVQLESFVEGRWTADVSVEGDGWNGFVAAYGFHRIEQGANGIDRYGLAAHAGVYATETLEPFVQYSLAGGGDGEGTLSVLVAGANKYFAGHALKLTGDVGYVFEPVTDAFDNEPRTVLIDAAGEDGQVFARVQLQVVF